MTTPADLLELLEHTCEQCGGYFDTAGLHRWFAGHEYVGTLPNGVAECYAMRATRWHVRSALRSGDAAEIARTSARADEVWGRDAWRAHLEADAA